VDDAFEAARAAKADLQRQLERANDGRRQRVQHLDRGNGKLLGAWQWLQQNKGKFKGKVYGPLAAEVDIPDELHARYLEQHVSSEYSSMEQ
jgi:hypothetical protein